ncbi:MAG: hypothetical protein HW386_2489 [Gammaproteobacteria bacterium]|nr:hypothetical protein [Gammaproteobacteria bacterium]
MTTSAIGRSEDWAHETFGRADLGDSRRTRRLVKLAGDLARHIGKTVVQSCGGQEAAVEGAYRLVRNNRISAAAIADSGYAATAERVQRCGLLLALEDSTTLSYGHQVVAELGDLGGPKGSNQRGYLVHSVLLLDGQSERIEGLIDQVRWRRESRKRGQRHQRRSRAYEEKESYKWEQASVRVATRLGGKMREVISVCDREADVYEYLRYKVTRQQRYIVRNSWNRRTAGEAGDVRATARQLPGLGQYQVLLAQKGGRRARRAEVTLKAGVVTLRCPRRAPGRFEDLTMNLVLVEEAGREGKEKLEWLLLTSEPVDTFQQARQVVRYYELRWRVEEFHKAWKSGAGVERQRMQAAANLERMAVILAFVAIRLLQLRESVAHEEAPCTQVLSEHEWQALWLARETTPLPSTAPTLHWAYENIARLGGWNDSKRTGRPGWQTIWNGWFILQERAQGFTAAMNLMKRNEKM